MLSYECPENIQQNGNGLVLPQVFNPERRKIQELKGDGKTQSMPFQAQQQSI